MSLVNRNILNLLNFTLSSFFVFAVVVAVSLHIHHGFPFFIVAVIVVCLFALLSLSFSLQVFRHRFTLTLSESCKFYCNRMENKAKWEIREKIIRTKRCVHTIHSWAICTYIFIHSFSLLHTPWPMCSRFPTLHLGMQHRQTHNTIQQFSIWFLG